jgi:N-acetyl-gamma-glutamyl-phosphate reductase
VTFTPHLVPLDQGELVSCYVTLNEAVDIAALYAAAYDSEPFVEVVDHLPGVREVRGTNLCRINARIDERTGKAFVFAVIDNLWKGAASQAIQNLNLMLGFPEAQGIEL